jgi:hypothetical protein
MLIDPYYSPENSIYLGVDFGWKNNAILWLQPSADHEKLQVLYVHYQAFRTNEENAKIALKIHQARGYGQLSGGAGDPSKPEALRSYSQVFGVEIVGQSGRVDAGHELVKQWLKAATLTKGESGLTFAKVGKCACGEYCYRRFLGEFNLYREHVPGTGPHHGLDGLRYFLTWWVGLNEVRRFLHSI